jgi:hypothetical protein
MRTLDQTSRTKVSPGGWLPHNPKHVDSWIRKLKKSVGDPPRELVEPIREFEQVVYRDPGWCPKNALIVPADAETIRF